ncbi:hypothetical protein JKP88DRAFT_309953 [Tribonema minus]|uniref:Uncharacterized protein n=1 Tax=Tribonema minus TaxID=303371 RepID=A0A835Z4L8_9STRA|nr:hypothetical protein JKP88DRAFT_309953 [Tribonema minus]
MVGLVDYALTNDEEDEVVAKSRGAKRAHAAVQPAPDEGVEEGGPAPPSQGSKRRHAGLPPPASGVGGAAASGSESNRASAAAAAAAPPEVQRPAVPAAANVHAGGLLLVAPRPPPAAGAPLAAGVEYPAVSKYLIADTADGFREMEEFLISSNDWNAAQHNENQRIYTREMQLVEALQRQRRPIARKVKKQRKALAQALGRSGEDLQEGVVSILSSRQAERAALLAAIIAQNAARSAQVDTQADPSTASAPPLQPDADISQLAALEAEITQLAAFATVVKQLSAHDDRIEEERDKAAGAIFKAVNARHFISDHWHFLLPGPSKLVVHDKYPDSFADPRGNGPNKDPLDLLAHIDVHGQSAARVKTIFCTFPEPVLSLFGWVVLITGRGVHSRAMTRAQVKAGELGVGVTYYASSPGVMLVITHELYKQALERGITFAAPAPGFAA